MIITEINKMFKLMEECVVYHHSSMGKSDAPIFSRFIILPKQPPIRQQKRVTRIMKA